MNGDTIKAANKYWYYWRYLKSKLHWSHLVYSKKNKRHNLSLYIKISKPLQERLLFTKSVTIKINLAFTILGRAFLTFAEHFHWYTRSSLFFLFITQYRLTCSSKQKGNYIIFSIFYVNIVMPRGVARTTENI